MTLTRISIVSILSTVLLACATGPKPVPRVEQPKVVDTPATATPIAPQDYLQQAKQANNESEKLALLLDAADAWQQTDCNKSLRIIETLRDSLTFTTQQGRATLIEAECLYQHDMGQQANGLLLAHDFDLSLQPRLLTLRAHMAEQENRALDAARLYQQLSHYDVTANQKIWPLLKQLSLKQLEQAALQRGELKAWLQLALITRHFANDALLMASQLQQWRAQYPNHPANLTLPEDLDQALQTQGFKPQHVAVLLPLSGRLQAQGEAIKQGLLAAYFPQSGQRPVIQFFDTNRLPMAEIATQLTEVDFVIGPLLKDNIDALAPLIPDKPMLALNRSDAANHDEHYFYALAPEDEGQQLARSLLERGFQHPVLAISSSPALQRMAASFSLHWQLQKDKLPPQVIFDSNKTMQQGMESLLEVDQSNQRIKAIQSMFPGEVHAFHRNRQDVDAIVLFANPEETELLVPIIESSISPFSAIIPVFASSRSFSHDLKANSLRDLHDLSFIDMPWMLPQHGWVGVEQQSEALWPNQQDSLKRLFAMGYDSWQMIPHLRHMAILPELRVKGMTGELALDENQTIHRTLSWGKIQQEKVIKLAME